MNAAAEINARLAQRYQAAVDQAPGRGVVVDRRFLRAVHEVLRAVADDAYCPPCARGRCETNANILALLLLEGGAS